MSLRIVVTVLALTVGAETLAGPAVAQQDEVGRLKTQVAALEAQLKALQADLERLKRGAARLPAELSERERKWVKGLADEFLKGMVAETSFAVLKRFVHKDLHASFTDRINDPYVKVEEEWGDKMTGDGSKKKRGAYSGARRVAVWTLFEKCEIKSEEVSPDGSEVVFRGEFSGNKGLAKTEEYDEPGGGFGAAGNWHTTRIVAGKLGPRTGEFLLRVAREKDSNRWEVVQFRWEVAQPKE
jgi:hypothetical protein